MKPLELKLPVAPSETPNMLISGYILTLLAATGTVLVLYIMRRRVRLGRRVPKF